MWSLIDKPSTCLRTKSSFGHPSLNRQETMIRIEYTNQLQIHHMHIGYVLPYKCPHHCRYYIVFLFLFVNDCVVLHANWLLMWSSWMVPVNNIVNYSFHSINIQEIMAWNVHQYHLSSFWLSIYIWLVFFDTPIYQEQEKSWNTRFL